MARPKTFDLREGREERIRKLIERRAKELGKTPDELIAELSAPDAKLPAWEALESFARERGVSVKELLAK